MKKFLVLATILTVGGLASQAQAGFGGDNYCREYNNSVVIGGQVQSSYGVACMQPDGSWAIQSRSGGYTPAHYTVPQPVYTVPAPYPVYQPYPAYQSYPSSSFSLVIGFDDDDWKRRGNRHWNGGHGHGRGHGHWNREDRKSHGGHWRH